MTDRLLNAEYGLQRKLNLIKDRVYEDLKNDLDDIHSDYKVLKSEYDALKSEFSNKIKCLMEKHRKICQGIEDELVARVPYGECRSPEPAEAEELEDPLYDSGRGYIEQMKVYKRHQRKAEDLRALEKLEDPENP